MDDFYVRIFSCLFWVYLFLNAFCSFFRNLIASAASSSDRRDRISVLDWWKACMQSFQTARPSGVSKSRVIRRSLGARAELIKFFSNSILIIFDTLDFSKRRFSPSSFWLIGPCQIISFNTLNCCCFSPNRWQTWFISLCRNRPHFNNSWTMRVSFSGGTGFFLV